jgi:Family of unknown function (DUF5309)
VDKSYSFQHLKRDLTDEFQIIRAKAPTLISVIGTSERRAKGTKYEWLEDVVSAAEDKAAAGALSTDETINVVVGAKFAAGQLIAVDGSLELIKVVSVAGNALTVERGYGDSTPEAITSGDLIRIVSRPKEQGTNPGDDKAQAPAPAHNFTQIFDRTAKVSKSAEASGIYGLDNLLDYQVQFHMDSINRELNTSLIYSRKKEAAEGVPGSAGGILQFLSQPGSLVTDASGAAVSDGLLNNTLEKLVLAGGRPVTLLTNTNQARKISGFNRAAANYTVLREDRTAGNAVWEFQGDLPIDGYVQRIVVDPNFPKNMIAVLDLERIKLVPFRDMGDEDATIPGGDYFSRRVLGEYSFEVKNALQSHALIRNLEA